MNDGSVLIFYGAEIRDGNAVVKAGGHAFDTDLTACKERGIAVLEAVVAVGKDIPLRARLE